ncbi:MAG: ferredoxin family protein [Deltaproteobacteria bacterium]|nr:ferredoxin family protein [Deltaproteobacteria bacterium]
MPPVIDRELCTGCGTCEDICPGDIIRMNGDEPEVAYPEECFHCGACFLDCPEEAISYRIPIPMLLPAYEKGFFEK